MFKDQNSFLKGDHLIYSHKLFFLLCTAIVKRKLMLVSMGTQRVKNRKDAKFVQDLSKTNKDVAPQKL